MIQFDPMTDEEIADFLDKVHDEILVRGRCTGTGEVDGKICLLGGMAAAAEDQPIRWAAYGDHPACHALSEYLSRHGWERRKRILGFDSNSGTYVSEIVDFADDTQRVFFFNDEHRAGEQDDPIFDALRNCAKELREKAQAG